MRRMGATYLMSYPGPRWQIRGGENFLSQSRSPTSPRKAMHEWLSLCDAITRAGGRILVMPPAEGEGGAPLTGMVYTANAGQLFHDASGWTWLVSKMAVAHRQAERAHVRAFLEKAGLPVREAANTWEGQADLQHVIGNRYIATWGVRSVRESLDDVRPLLPPGAHLLELQLRDPFFHGDVCLNPIVTKNNVTVLLAHNDAFVGGGIVAIRNFLGERVEVLPVDRDDAVGYACNALCVNGTVFLPGGLSTQLRSHLVRRGFLYEEIDLPELLGKGGGGPRCLVNELRGLVVNPGAPDYVTLREDLFAKAETYPEVIEPPAPPAATPPKPQS